MDILIIHPWIQIGGAELVCVNLANELGRHGHRARIATLFVEAERMGVHGMKVEYVLPPRPISALCRKSRTLFYVIGPMALFWVAFANSKTADLLNPHNFPAHWIAVLVRLLRGVPIVWTCNEPPARLKLTDISRVGALDYAGWLVASSPLDRLLVKWISAIQVLSTRVRTQVEELYRRDSVVIRSGVDPAAHANSDPSSAIRKFGLDRKYRLLVVGKLHPQKNQSICLAALKAVCNKIPEAILILVGRGPMRAELERMAVELGITQRVKFLGEVPLGDLIDLYAACHVNLLPAVNQSWGLTPFEALCAGRISIVSSDSGAAEVIERERIGVVAKPTAEDFADRILEVHASSLSFTKMAARGKQYVEECLTHSDYAERFLELAQQALEPHVGEREAPSSRVKKGHGT